MSIERRWLTGYGLLSEPYDSAETHRNTVIFARLVTGPSHLLGRAIDVVTSAWAPNIWGDEG